MPTSLRKEVWLKKSKPVLRAARFRLKKKKLVRNARRKNKKPAPNPLKIDPTRTATLRRVLTAELRKRFAKLRFAVVRLIRDEDALGLKERKPLSFNQALELIRNAYNPDEARDEKGQWTAGEGGQARAKAGGEEGPNGEWYPGGAFIATTDLPKKVKDKITKEATGKVRVDGFTFAVPEPGKMSILDKLGGTVMNPRDGEINYKYLEYIKASAEQVKEYEGIVAQWKGGERWINVNDHPNIAGIKDAARLVAAGQPVPGALLNKLPADWQNNLKRYKPPARNSLATNRWQLHSTPEQVKAFQAWLRSQIAETLTDAQMEQLWEQFAQAGFEKGAARAFDDTRASVRAAMETDQLAVSDFYKGTKDEFLRSAFNQPVAVDKIKLLAGRSFNDLQGITEAMSTKMVRALTVGLVQGDSPYEIAKVLADEVDITSSRAEMIARTEIVRAHAEGQLEALDKLGVEEVGVAVEWSTTGDDKVCPECSDMEGVVLTLDEAQGMIPLHPS